MSRNVQPLRIIALTAGSLLAVAVTIGLAVDFSNQAGHKTSSSEQCGSGIHHDHRVTIKAGTVTPLHTTAPLCDTLTITNLDTTQRLMAFGEHEHHQPYDGVGEKLLGQGQSLRVTLVQAGNFKFHDHLHDQVQGTFTVTSQ